MLAATGRTLIGAGLLILSFVVYQLWGTGIAESRGQNSLRSAFEKKAAELADGASDLDQPVDPATADTPPPAPAGDAIAIMRIPKIGIDKAIVQGVSVPDLKKAPGHYPDTPMPGQPGNSAIAGHRTTYGSPFYRIDELEPGDPILVTTLEGTFRYEVREQSVVTPDRVDVLYPTDDTRLTLTTCEPRFSAAKRLIVVAHLVDSPPPPPTPEGEPTTATTTSTTVPPEAPPTQPIAIESGLSGEPVSSLPAVVWGLDTAALGIGISQLAKRWRRKPAYLLGALPFLLLLFLFFESFSRLLPANY